MNPFVSEASEKFRAEVRAFIKEQYPPHLREKREGDVLAKDDYLSWHRVLAAKGWIAPSWPVEYGGAGWGVEQRYIWQEELAYADTISLPPMGVNMLAPVICAYGTLAQKERFLGPTLSGDIFWCQGYSEPQAGSDLAGVTTKAVRDGDRYFVSGQKMWTSMAQYADLIFCLVRTDPEARQQRGISFLLIDMKSPGITIKPIETLGGDLLVNEVWFDDVVVPVENRVGEENRGWDCAKFLLGLERTGIANVARSKRKLMRLKETLGRTRAGEKWLSEDSAFGAKVADLEIDLAALEYSELRILADEGRKNTGAAASLLKIRGAEIQQRLAELTAEAAGYFCLAKSGDAVWDEDFRIHYRAGQNYLSARRTSIYGGTNEIQRNIIAKSVLGL